MATTITHRPLAATAPPAPAAAALNWRHNHAALAQTQPRLANALSAVSTGRHWLYARDGSLTAFDASGHWLHHCSVPLRASEAMLTTLDVKGRVACLLAPTLAAAVRVTLHRSRPDQAVLALCPSLEDLHTLLHCHDFSAALRARRLWFAWGDAWAAELKQLFDDQPGLATPAQFIRLPTTPPDTVDRLVQTAQQVFGEVNTKRAATIARRRDDWPSIRNPRSAIQHAPRLCVIAPSHFKLWHDAGALLAATLIDESSAHGAVITAFDPDDPSRSSALALLDASGDCDAVVSADTSRADLPNVLPPDQPWITWLTAPNVPARGACGPRDALLLADPAWRDLALRAGWTDSELSVAGWPTAPAPAGDREGLALIADTRPVVMPEKLAEFSSHQLLWGAIAAELSKDPFCLGDDPAAFLEQRMRRAGVRPEGFDAALFLTHLILPAYEQSLARLILAERLPLRLHGHGWADIEEFRAHAAGPITSRASLARIAAESRAIVHAVPSNHAHPADGLGVPVVRRHGMSRAVYIQSLRAALAGHVPLPAPVSPLSLHTLARATRP